MDKEKLVTAQQPCGLTVHGKSKVHIFPYGLMIVSNDAIDDIPFADRNNNSKWENRDGFLREKLTLDMLFHKQDANRISATYFQKRGTSIKSIDNLLSISFCFANWTINPLSKKKKKERNVLIRFEPS
ncbi:8147_t:CDS:2 [Funneliformis mosseae]|uniref:8147_t:CDS:1 n=1 Tax=Funneliformis mosseae TaxID=27381 RepID=A0A9N9AKJ1_FUNMO|nr:8147_t:CDS:2 [Funneliformis mosseae]